MEGRLRFVEPPFGTRLLDTVGKSLYVKRFFPWFREANWIVSSETFFLLIYCTVK